MNPQPAGAASSASDAGFLFLSPHRSVRARGIAAQITAPARAGRDTDAFRRDVEAALAVPRADGRKPILIGAIPFDLTQPSCLHIPQEYAFFERGAAAAAASQTGAAEVVAARSIPDEPTFKAGVNQAIANFQHSPIKKAVLSRILEMRLAEPVDVTQLFANLIAQNPSGFHFRLPLQDGAALIGASPELLLRKHGAHVHSNPLAGSAKRQTDPDADRRVAETLRESAKDLYEHRLVIDEIRAVLADHCRELRVPGAPSLISTAAMWHLSTAIDGVLADPRQSVLDLACRLHPTPAVCGSPTALSRKLIDLIEPFERGLFSGMVGWCDADGDGEWVVTIRCGVVQRDLVRLFAGAGIVEASCPDSEWRETQAKLGTMLSAFGIAAGSLLP
ncbi:MAG TPA: isochorismate synthase [Tahibacter sp.]|uniref:isochorismate synthase n=1 Tax=Tahibacter sp. TaxID=2056211 RepID=UPI002B7887C6|nr:isochorismate synthase [Tahibacter sp.]HSX61721.1 isochorismate synthase [Tahibacter sp.]